MERLGFKLGPNSFWFYRERGGFIDYLDFWMKSSGCYVTIPVMCLKTSLIMHCDMENFPKNFNKGIPFYSSTFINEDYGVEIGGDPWDVSTESDIENMLNESLELLSDSGEKWWKAINNDTDFYESFTINFKESNNADIIKEKLDI